MFHRITHHQAGSYFSPILVGLLIFSFVITAIHQQPQRVRADAGTGLIEGQVTDAEGVPLANIQVNLQSYAGLDADISTTTDASGQFNLTAPAGNEYRLLACPGCDNWSAHKYANRFYGGSDVSHNTYYYNDAEKITITEAVQTFNFSLEPGAALSGTLEDTHGQPVSSFFIKINNEVGKYVGGSATDLAGTYAIYGLPASIDLYPYACADCNESNTYANGYFSPTGMTNLTDDAQFFTFTDEETSSGTTFILQNGYSISGVVKDASENPISGVDIHAAIQVSSAPYEEIWVSGVQSSSDGSYQVSHLLADTYQLSANPSANEQPYIDWRQSIAVSASLTQDIILDRANFILGQVVDGDEQGIAHISINVMEYGTDNYINSAETDANGYYQVSNLPDGDYQVYACAECSHLGYLSQTYGQSEDTASTRITLANGQTASDINFTLEPALIISGRIMNESGDGIENINVFAESTTNPDLFFGTNTSAGDDYFAPGGYELYLPAGYYRLNAAATTDNNGSTTSNYVRKYYPSSFTLEEAQVLQVTTDLTDINMELSDGGAISGTLSAGGQSVGNAIVMAVNTSDPRISFRNNSTADSGAYTISNVTPGVYKLRAMLAGYQPQYFSGTDWEDAQTIVVSAGTTQTGKNIAFSAVLAKDTDPETVTVEMNRTLTPIHDYNPAWAANTAQGTIDDQIFAGLTRTDAESGVVIPNLASSIVSSNNNQDWTFTIKSGLTWSDGSPLSASDFRYGILRNVDSNNDCSYFTNLFVINGLEAYCEGQASASEIGITTVGNQITFHLNTPTPQFAAVMTLPFARPLPQHLVQLFSDEWLEPQYILTSGPFKLVSFLPNEEAVFQRNTQFTDNDGNQIDQIILHEYTSDKAFSEFANGKLTTAMINADLAATIDQNEFGSGKLVEVPQKCTYFLGFNPNALPAELIPVNQGLLRKALIESLDRGTINTLFQGGWIASAGYISPGVFGYNSVPDSLAPAFNQTQALADYQSAYSGTIPSWEGKEFTLYYNLSLDPQNTAHNQAVTQYIADTWNNLFGMNLTVSAASSSFDYNEMRKNNGLLVWQTGWCSDYNDGYNFFMFPVANSGTFGDWDLATFETDLNAAAAIVDPAVRYASYQDLVQYLLTDQALIMPIGYSVQNYLSRNFVPSFGTGGIDYIADWELEMTSTYTVGQLVDSAVQSNLDFRPQNEDGVVSYSFANDAFSDGVVLSHTVMLTTQMENKPDSLKTTPYFFDFEAIHTIIPVTPRSDVTITVHYTPEIITAAGINEKALALYYWDASASQWVKDAHSSVDIAADTLTTTTHRTGLWAVMGGTEAPPNYLFIPVIRK